MSATGMPVLAASVSLPVTETTPRLRLDQQVVGLFVAVGAVGAVPAEVAHDQVGEIGLQAGVVEAEPLDRAGRQVLDEDIGPLQQLRQDLLTGRGLQVERQRLLRAVGPGEVAAQPEGGGVIVAGEVAAAGPLDLDDAGAEVGQMARGQRRRDRLLQ